MSDGGNIESPPTSLAREQQRKRAVAGYEPYAFQNLRVAVGGFNGIRLAWTIL